MEVTVWSGADMEPMQVEHCLEEAVKLLPSRALKMFCPAFQHICNTLHPKNTAEEHLVRATKEKTYL